MGVDPASGRKPFIWAVFNPRIEIIAIRQGSLEELITFIRGIPQVMVAVNSPRSFSSRLMEQAQYRQEISPSPRAGRYTSFRVCEYQLKIRNIRVIPVPHDLVKIPGWILNAFLLYQNLASNLEIRVIEVNAHAAYCALLGRIPFIKNTLEGRIQRQLVLADQGVQIHDPMMFFEEVTPRRILQGTLPEGIVHSPRELDALVAAFTAWQLRYHPEKTLALGDEDEGQIILPVKTLKDRYY